MHCLVVRARATGMLMMSTLKHCQAVLSSKHSSTPGKGGPFPGLVPADVVKSS